MIQPWMKIMTIHNSEIAEKFFRLANLLEIEGANPFRVRAYRNAARVILSLKNVAELIAQGEDLTELPGIGEDLAEKIKIIVKTGELPILKKIEKRIPAILHELMKIEGLGPKRIQMIYKSLGIKNTTDLKNAISKGRLRNLRGFGEKIEQKILQGILHSKQYAKRFKLADAFPIVESLIIYLKKIKTIKQIECAGSFRRRKETVGDLDLLIASGQGKNVIDHFVQFDEVAEIISQGTTRSAVRLHSGMQVDLRVVPEKSYGAALIYFTGSKDHNIAIRKLALQKKLKVNEYGIFKGKKYLADDTEKEMYREVGLAYIEPELREDHGEIAAARENKLPQLITLNDIRGDLHCHTRASDGNASLEELATAAENFGYEYLAITDHSKHLSAARSFDKKALLKQIKAIDALNAKLKKIIILKSIEVDILEDGKLDLPNEVLKELDLTVCAIHSKFNLSAKKQTERIIRAMDNPYFTILAHPTTRLINQREPCELAMERVFVVAKERSCILELNAQPERLDLNYIYCKMAKEAGVKIAICTDAHNVAQFAYMRYGIFEARRGWLEKKDVVNTYSLAELKKFLRR